MDEDISERLEKLEERIAEAEVVLDTLSTGQSIICSTLEMAGLMKGGEPVKPAWDPGKIGWIEAEGARGPYQRYPRKDQKAEATSDYKNMLADLKAHNGRMMRGDYFYWVFSDAATVGRKLRKGKKPEPHAEKAAEADVETIKSKFPEDLASLLTFEAVGEYITIKPRQFLGSDAFSKIASIVRGLGGEYLSMGKQSHFRVSR